MASTRLYRDGTLLLEDFPVDDVSEHLSEPGVTIWVDLEASDQGTLDQVALELGIHEIAIENATAGGQRPKIDRYPDHAFLAAYALRLDQDSGRLDTSALTAFVTSQTVVTVRQDDLIDVERAADDEAPRRRGDAQSREGTRRLTPSPRDADPVRRLGFARVPCPRPAHGLLNLRRGASTRSGNRKTTRRAGRSGVSTPVLFTPAMSVPAPRAFTLQPLARSAGFLPHGQV